GGVVVPEEHVVLAATEQLVCPSPANQFVVAAAAVDEVVAVAFGRGRVEGIAVDEAVAVDVVGLAAAAEVVAPAPTPDVVLALPTDHRVGRIAAHDPVIAITGIDVVALAL